MNEFVEQFESLDTAYLLGRRALGPDGLSDEAHRAIEIVLTKRGVEFPPIPDSAIYVTESQLETTRSLWTKRIVIFVGTVIVSALAKQIAGTYAGLAFLGFAVLFMLFDKKRRSTLTDIEKANEDDERVAKRDGLTELMQASSRGDLKRASELVAYGDEVNQASLTGSTALMFAAKAGHIAVVQFLLDAGADIHAKTEKGKSALDFAGAASNPDIFELLQSRRNPAT